MSDVVIRVEDVYKEYILGKIGYGTLKDDLKSWWARIRGKEDPNSIIGQQSRLDLKHKHFLALNGVSFEVKEGEAVGIIGRNGAGKSTLLKILSRITTPSRGAIKIKGRISSLLEVGTGFHPELTGRENIYLNGAILGMKKKEIDKKLDEIIAFAGIEEFIDTPVKRYSSGMYVRLAFSVAAHLDSDILILDEVLAVGDAKFQKKCLGKMDDVTKNQGRTILFVSHNMAAVKNLCSRGILLKDGKVEVDGSVDEAVLLYTRNNINLSIRNLKEIINNLPEDEILKIFDIQIYQNNEEKNPFIDKFDNSQPFEIIIKYEIKKEIFDFRLYFDICNSYNNIIFRSFYDDSCESKIKKEKGFYYSKVIIPPNIFGPFEYILKIRGTIHNVRSIFNGLIEIPLNIISNNNFNKLYGIHYRDVALELLLKWENKKIE